MICHAESTLNRRRFLHWAGMAGVVTVMSPRAMAQEEKAIFVHFGCNGSLANAAVLKAAGATFMTGRTDDFLMPAKLEEDFEKSLEALKSSPLPLLACNGFIRPEHLRCVGEEANHDQILIWAEIAFRRLQKAGGKFMIFGSGGSRCLLNGWPVEKANEQFGLLLKAMGPLAQKHGITVVVEQLNARECNFLTRLGEVADLVRKAGHPHIRACADLYHMAVEGDGPEALKAAMDVVAHVEIAEKEGRSYPRVGGQDFRPFFRVLRDAGYRGAINFEAKGGLEPFGAAVLEVKKQAAEVIAEV